MLYYRTDFDGFAFHYLFTSYHQWVTEEWTNGVAINQKTV